MRVRPARIAKFCMIVIASAAQGTTSAVFRLWRRAMVTLVVPAWRLSASSPFVIAFYQAEAHCRRVRVRPRRPRP